MKTPLWLRAVRFQTVGLIGIGVQLLMLILLKEMLGLDPLVATLVAVETAIIHNFIWHERWTWASGAAGVAGRFARFQISTGLVTLVNNLVVMAVLVRVWHVHYVLANLLAISAGGVANFLLNDGWVFRNTLPPE